jgi:hypothetical protein
VSRSLIIIIRERGADKRGGSGRFFFLAFVLAFLFFFFLNGRQVEAV